MPSPLFLDLTHTSHTRARTGVQRVSRALEGGLAGRCTPVAFDPYEGAWRPLEAWEEANLKSADPAKGRSSRWPIGARVRGEVRRLRRRQDMLAAAPAAALGGLIVPEIFSQDVADALPSLFAATGGPRVAVFHDALALQFPEFTPRSTVSRFPGYLRDLLAFDGVAAVSETSRASLLGYWRWLGATRVPEVVAIALGTDPAPSASPTAAAPDPPIVLCVSSIEGRKNHAALLDACERLWSSNARFQLRLVGLANMETGAEAIRLLEKLRTAGRPIRYDGPATDTELEAAYRECSFTIYPSLAEGFGLPVAESLARGKPCLCRLDGATGEIARQGGCVGIGSGEAGAIAAALGGVLSSPAQLVALETEARGRRFRTWPEYISEFTAWMGGVRRSAQ
jgi:glycosyltransferase involved in cell wall biosynthesis